MIQRDLLILLCKYIDNDEIAINLLEKNKVNFEYYKMKNKEFEPFLIGRTKFKCDNVICANVVDLKEAEKRFNGTGINNMTLKLLWDLNVYCTSQNLDKISEHKIIFPKFKMINNLKIIFDIRDENEETGYIDIDKNILRYYGKIDLEDTNVNNLWLTLRNNKFVKLPKNIKYLNICLTQWKSLNGTLELDNLLTYISISSNIYEICRCRNLKIYCIQGAINKVFAMPESVICLCHSSIYNETAKTENNILENIKFLEISLLDQSQHFCKKLIYLEWGSSYTYEEFDFKTVKYYPYGLKYFVIKKDGPEERENKDFDVSLLPDTVKYLYLGKYKCDIKKLPKKIKFIFTRSTNKKFVEKLKRNAEDKFQVFKIGEKKHENFGLSQICKNSYKFKKITEEKIEDEIEKMFWDLV